MDQRQAGAQGARRDTRQVKVASEKETGTNPGDLQMTSAEMRDLTQKVADLVLDRYEGLTCRTRMGRRISTGAGRSADGGSTRGWALRRGSL